MFNLVVLITALIAICVGLTAAASRASPRNTLTANVSLSVICLVEDYVDGALGIAGTVKAPGLGRTGLSRQLGLDQFR